MARSKMSVYVKPAGAALPAPKKENAPLPDIDLANLPAESEPVKKGKRAGKTGALNAGPREPRPTHQPDPDSTAVQTDASENEAAPPGEQTTLEKMAVSPDKPQPQTPAAQTPEPVVLAEAPAQAPQSPNAEMTPAQAPAAGPQNAAMTPAQNLSAAPMQASSLEPLRVLEAALFMSSMAMPTVDLGKLVGIGAVGHVSTLLQQLSKQYEQSGSSLEVVEENAGKWVMRIRAPFAPSVRRFAGEAEIPKHALRTLAYISRHEGITKRELFRRLGGTIYEDVGELVDKGFLQAKPVGRTQALSTTTKFKQYFQG